MKRWALVIVVGLGLVIGVWWTREPAPDQAAEQPPARRAPITRLAPTAPSHAVPRLPMVGSQGWPTLEPSDEDPKQRERQEAFWRELRRFASEAELSDTQWDQFIRDVSELAEIESTATLQSVRAGNFYSVVELNHELGQELEARCAAYMNEQQLRVFRFRLDSSSVVAQVRRLYSKL